jgi:hypothetical protein
LNTSVAVSRTPSTKPPTGQVIQGGEEKVRDLFTRFCQAAYQTALHQEMDAAEAAFSPSQSPQRLHSKGREDDSVLTVNDRIVLSSGRWSAPGMGSCIPLGVLLDAAAAP